MDEIIKGLKCPLCDEEKLHPIKHLYSKISFGLKWYYCEECEKDICKDKLTGQWKIAAYDFYPEEFEDEEEDLEGEEN